jgi:hypothetical protein
MATLAAGCECAYSKIQSASEPSTRHLGKSKVEAMERMRWLHTRHADNHNLLVLPFLLRVVDLRTTADGRVGVGDGHPAVVLS